jgi:carboxymethylenebutenolidase
MQTTTVDVPTPDGVADAYLVRPDGDGPHPGVLFAMDAIGLRPRIAEMAERIAAQGYVVLAPNTFYRGGRAPVVALPDFSDPDQRAGFMEKVWPLIGALDGPASVSDGGAYLDYLAEVAPGPVGLTGYCMGARFALRVAAAYPDRVAALGGFHGGGLVTEGDDSAHLSAGSVQGEVYFGHADKDHNMAPEQIAVLDAALDEGGVRHRSEVYTGALHGYTMSDTAVYDEAACERHFTELFALLERNLP